VDDPQGSKEEKEGKTEDRVIEVRIGRKAILALRRPAGLGRGAGGWWCRWRWWLVRGEIWQAAEVCLLEVVTALFQSQ